MCEARVVIFYFFGAWGGLEFGMVEFTFGARIRRSLGTI